MKAEARIEGGIELKTVHVICLHHVPKSYRPFQVETSQQNMPGGFSQENRTLSGR